MNKNFGIGLLVGLFIGGITALLVAPKPGKETRKEIATKFKEIKAKVSKKDKVD